MGCRDGDAGDAEKDVAPTYQIRVLLDQACDGGLDSIELPCDLCKALGGLALEKRDGEGFLAVLRGRSVLDERGARSMEFTQGIQCFICDWTGLQLEGHPHSSEHDRIAGIGLRQLAAAFSEAPCAQGVDLDQRQPCIGKGALQSVMVAAGRLVDDPRDARSYPVEQGAMPVAVIREFATPARQQAVNAESVFRDVDADGMVCSGSDVI